MRRFVGHTGTVYDVAFSPDGRYVLTGSLDGTARLWWTNLGDVTQFACDLLPRDFTADERAQYSITDTTPTCPRFAGSAAS